MKQAIFKSLNLRVVLLGFLMSIVSVLCLEAKNRTDAECEKFYVSIEKLWIAEEGMFVNLEGNSVPIQVLYYDEKGFYLTKLPESAAIRCPKCKKWHGEWETCPEQEKKANPSDQNVKKGKKKK